MISVKNLKKSYDDVAVLKNVNVEIEKGEIISIIGPSGTGKSTFLRCLNLLETPTDGEIWVNGENILFPKADITKLRMKMGMVFQSFNLFPHLNVIENIALAPQILLKQPKLAAMARGFELLKMVGLRNKAFALPTELSGGQQQRIAIARTLAMNPEIILFDEPTSALDPTMVNEVLSVIRQLAKTGITMLIVTHEMRFARDVSTRVLYMDEGVIYEEGPAKEIFDNPQRPKTKAFVRRIGMKHFQLNRTDFDLYHFRGQVETFAEKQLLDDKQRKTLQLVMEELTTNLIFTHVEHITLNLEISEENRTTEISISSPEVFKNPFENLNEQEDMSRIIVKKCCSEIKFDTTADGHWEMHLVLK